MTSLNRRQILGSFAALAAGSVFAGTAGAVEMSATPFKVSISDEVLVDLKERLAMTRWPSEIPGTGWDRGTPVAFVKELAAYWQDYDWRATEARFNALPQFTADIDGEAIYFIHVRSAKADATPLLLIHGWPGSVLEFEQLIPALSADHHLVIPAIPGFGFSGPLHSDGWSTGRVGAAFAELMTQLGYQRFGVHGGDSGSLIARNMALDFADRISGAHVLQFFSFPSGDPAEFEKLTEDDHLRLARLELFGQRDSYNQVMGKRPQSIAYALNDSPVGLLVWMLELFATFGDHPEQLTKQQIIEHATLYWVTETMGSSANLYFDTGRSGAWEDTRQTTIPMGIAVFPNDFLSIRAFAERDHANIVHWTEMPSGGHFAGLEEPDLLAADIKAFFAKL
jgi:pimeloyl-ACP methyl ester carboxylesterase